MNKYRYTNKFNHHSYKPVTGYIDENDVADRFKDYIIKTFNVNNETVTKLEKSRIKQLYFSQFPQESQGIICFAFNSRLLKP